jgi:hypothetical protein
MLYLVEAHPSIERANVVDAGEGPGPVIAKIVERFRPEAIYGNPSAPPGFHGGESRYSGADRGADVCPRLVRRHGAHVHSDHAAGDLWRGDRQREADYNPAEIGPPAS